MSGQPTSPTASNATSASSASRAAAAFRRAAACSARANTSAVASSEDRDEAAYQAEIDRINTDLAALRAQSSGTAAAYLPPLYLRGRDAAAEEVLCQLRDTSKSFELNLRFREIEKLDRMHAKLWELLSEQNRSCIAVEAYKDVMQRFQAWCQAEFGIEPVSEERALPRGSGEVGSAASGQSASAPTHSGSVDPPAHGRDESQVKEGSPTARASDTWRGGTSAMRRRVRPSESLQRPVDDGTALRDVLFLANVKTPRPTMELFLSCPRNTFFPDSVDVAVMYQLFAKKVSLVKCEAELIMWDTNNDGRLSEDEMENYVRDLVPRMAALRNMSDEVLPFYCCTASRRLFWDLDPGNRGVVRIDALLQSAVMDEWVSLQLLTEDNPRNWFGAMATQQLYEKFLLLDTRNEGTLNVENLHRYKKGLPTVLDDGLPLHVSPLCTLFIDRFFETNMMMARSEMDYRKFVDFVIAVEMLPQCSRPMFLWNIIDLRGDGVVTAMTANYFFRETHAKLVSAGIDVPARETVVQEVFDLIPTAEPLKVTREEFIASPQAGLFVALLIDCLSFWAYENREQR